MHIWKINKRITCEDFTSWAIRSCPLLRGKKTSKTRNKKNSNKNYVKFLKKNSILDPFRNLWYWQMHQLEKHHICPKRKNPVIYKFLKHFTNLSSIFLNTDHRWEIPWIWKTRFFKTVLKRSVNIFTLNVLQENYWNTIRCSRLRKQKQ